MSEVETPAETPVADDHVIVKLAKPIPVFAETVSELKMRPPTAADIISIGNPVLFSPFSDPPSVEHHPQKMTAMLARLASVPTSSLAKMDPQDWVSAAWAISPFFIPRAGTV